MAQLVAHLHGMQGVRGSNPLSSTNLKVILRSYPQYAQGVKMRVSLPDADVTSLKASGLGSAYEAAWSEWREENESWWCATSGDDLDRSAV